MKTIPRSDFIRAIQAGITAAGSQLTEPQRDALRQVAVSAKAVTGSFSSCPLTLAGLHNYITAEPAPVWEFVWAYDAVMDNHQSLVNMYETVVIVDDR